VDPPRQSLFPAAPDARHRRATAIDNRLTRPPEAEESQVVGPAGFPLRSRKPVPGRASPVPEWSYGDVDRGPQEAAPFPV